MRKHRSLREVKEFAAIYSSYEYFLTDYSVETGTMKLSMMYIALPIKKLIL
jgi:hypothetical protein